MAAEWYEILPVALSAAGVYVAWATFNYGKVKDGLAKIEQLKAVIEGHVLSDTKLQTELLERLSALTISFDRWSAVTFDFMRTVSKGEIQIRQQYLADEEKRRAEETVPRWSSEREK